MTFTSPLRARRRNPNADSAELAAFALLAAVLFAAMIAVRAWVVMILIGVLHAEVGTPPHTAGFWVCIPISILLGLLFHGGTNVKTE